MSKCLIYNNVVNSCLLQEKTAFVIIPFKKTIKYCKKLKFIFQS